VDEADASGGGLVQQPGDDARVQRVHHAVLVGVGGVHQDVHRALPASDRGQPQHGYASLRQPCEAAPQHVPYAFGDLGEGDQRAFAVQQPGAFAHVERVAAGALGDPCDGLLVGLAFGPYELRDGLVVQPRQR
jgi:hypothetical protein